MINDSRRTQEEPARRIHSPVLSYPILSCPVLSCPILSYPILSSMKLAIEGDRWPRALLLVAVASSCDRLRRFFLLLLLLLAMAGALARSAGRNWPGVL